MRDATFFLAGFVVGAVCVALALRWALKVTGYKTVAPSQPTGASPARAPVNTEVSAQRAITQASIERGAHEIMANAAAQGVRISEKEARLQAETMLKQLDPLGGVR